jgi:hypothetical protein
MLNKLPTDGREELCMDPHEKFLELCALSTSSELTPEEEGTLAKHLTNCAVCRKALQQFETVVDGAIPSVAENFGNDDGSQLDSTSDTIAEARLFQRLSEDHFQNTSASLSAERIRSIPRLRTTIKRLEFCVPYAAGIVLIVALGIFLFRKGEDRAALAVPPDPKTEHTDSAGQAKDAPEHGAALDAAKGLEVAERDKVISELRRQIQQQTSELASLRAREQKLQIDVQASDSERNRIAAERDSLSRAVQFERISAERGDNDLAGRNGSRLYGDATMLRDRLVGSSRR